MMKCKLPQSRHLRSSTYETNENSIYKKSRRPQEDKLVRRYGSKSIRDDHYFPNQRLLTAKNEYPFAYNVFLPGASDSIMDFYRNRHKLSIVGISCRLNLGCNEIIDGKDRERILRIEAKNEKELFRCLKAVSNTFPHWRIWDNGKFDNDLNLGDLVTE